MADQQVLEKNIVIEFCVTKLCEFCLTENGMIVGLGWYIIVQNYVKYVIMILVKNSSMGRDSTL